MGNNGRLIGGYIEKAYRKLTKTLVEFRDPIPPLLCALAFIYLGQHVLSPLASQQ